MHQTQMIENVILFAIVFALGEIISIPLFYFINKYFNQGKVKISISSVLKGNMERLFLFASLASAIPQSLIVFGALKIATRLKDKNDKVSNDYFLVGNLASLLLSLSYYLIHTLF